MALRPVEYDPETGSLWVRDPATGRAFCIASPDGKLHPPPVDFEKLAKELAGQFPSREELAASLEATGQGLRLLEERLMRLKCHHDDWQAVMMAHDRQLKRLEAELAKTTEEVEGLLERQPAPQSHWRWVTPGLGPLTEEFELAQAWPTPPGPGLIHASVDLRMVNEEEEERVMGVDLLVKVHNVRGEILEGGMQQLKLLAGPGETLTSVQLRGPVPGAGPEGLLRLEARRIPGAGGSVRIVGGILEIHESEDCG